MCMACWPKQKYPKNNPNDKPKMWRSSADTFDGWRNERNMEAKNNANICAIKKFT